MQVKLHNRWTIQQSIRRYIPKGLIWNSSFIEHTDLYRHTLARFHYITFKITGTFILRIKVYGHSEEDKQVWKCKPNPSFLVHIYFIFSKTSGLRKRLFEHKIYVSVFSSASSRKLWYICIYIYIYLYLYSYLYLHLYVTNYARNTSTKASISSNSVLYFVPIFNNSRKVSTSFS